VTHVLWVTEIASTPGPVTVEGPEGHHAADVRRLRVGEQVRLVDGAGAWGEGPVSRVARSSVTAEVLTTGYDAAPDLLVVVVQALPKGDRAELAVELSSEVGVDAIVPWQAQRCVTRWTGERGAKGLARWRAVAREAGKQARRTRFVTVRDPVETAGPGGLLELIGAAGSALLLDVDAPRALSEVELPGQGEVLLIVGPEGGLDPAELEALVGAGALQCHLGPSVLRTSGAGAVAAAVVLSRSGRWS
jgi:16S rRNA (uracil1498-N3)-methyltransferase